MGNSKARVIKEIEERLKERIVKEIELGKLSQTMAAKEYGVSRTSVQKWVKQYGKLRVKTKIVKVVMAEEKEKIKELQSALGDAHLKIRFYEKVLEMANKEYGIDLKKNYSTQASESLARKGTQ